MALNDIFRSLVLLERIPLPHPFDGVRKELRLGIANAVAGVPAEKILVVIAPVSG
jgi:hypothetical protein